MDRAKGIEQGSPRGGTVGPSHGPWKFTGVLEILSPAYLAEVANVQAQAKSDATNPGLMDAGGSDQSGR